MLADRAGPLYNFYSDIRPTRGRRRPGGWPRRPVLGYHINGFYLAGVAVPGAWHGRCLIRGALVD